MTASASRPYQRARRRDFLFAMRLARRPGFCCCCWCLQRPDRDRARRIFRLVRAINRASLRG